jgi:hypothetical protein
VSRKLSGLLDAIYGRAIVRTPKRLRIRIKKYRKRRAKATRPTTLAASIGNLVAMILGFDCFVESAVERFLPGDCSCKFGLGFCPFAPGQIAAPQLGPQFLDVVVKRDHLVLSFCF